MKPLLLLSIVALFSGCNKIYDAIHHGTSPTNCSINTVTDYIAGYNTITPRIATVHYNSSGNPESVTYDRRETGYGWVFFKYDKLKRLIELKEENSAIRKYVYNGYDSQPTHDTLWALTNPVVFIEYYTYDNKGRITKVATKFYHSEDGETYPDSEVTYSYNAQGNLVGDFNYDDKISVFSTHRLWMFIFHNYSVNNVANAVSYNSKGLPLDFTGSNVPGFTMNFFEGTFNGSQITYNCKGNR
ncbi:MAG: hypothetical protein J7497_15500 [Chitinophagaceae bacterium]|nr:hypothetical protein [Chitinophagaceae bacterium]